MAEAAADDIFSDIFSLDMPSAAESRGSLHAPAQTAVLAARAASLGVPTTGFEQQVTTDVHLFKSKLKHEQGRCDVTKLAALLAAAGHRVCIRTAIGGGHGQECFQHLHHVFLLVSRHGGANTAACIVDTCFRSHFQLSDQHMTEAYRAALPPSEEFVGTKSRATSLVRFLCGEMAAAFAAHGNSPPPWRTESSMLSMWRPSRFSDVIVLAPRSGIAAGTSHATTKAAELAGSNKGQSSSCSPTSPLDAEQQRQQQPLTAQLPLKRAPMVQTGFSVGTTSAVSRELGSQHLQWVTVPASPMAAQATQAPVSGPFDMWPALQRRGSGGCDGGQPGDEHTVRAIRTVRMVGKCRG